MRITSRGLCTSWLVAFLLPACAVSIGKNPAGPASVSSPISLSPPTETFTPLLPTAYPSTPTPLPSPTPTSVPPSLWISSTLPATFQSALVPPSDWTTADKPEEADIRLEIGTQCLVSRWVYALVAPFPTVTDGVTSQDLHQAWAGQADGAFALRPLLMDQNTLDVFSVLWGIPAPGAAQVVPKEQLSSTAWTNRPEWAVVPWESVEPRWKVLEVDGQSPMRKEFDPSGYPLAVPISSFGSSGSCNQTAVQSIVPGTNRDSSKLTTVLLTGVTALVRATAYEMERKGVLYPAQDIGDLMRAADLTHVSNEISFAQDCPPPDPNSGLVPFCSDPRYIDLLEYIGTDVVEMTGNHVRDWGSDALLYTMNLYTQRGWSFFGSGKDLESARKPVLLERNGNRLAFIGCNKPGNNGEWATDSRPGAAPCDFDYLRTELAQLRADGYLPIMTFQYNEYYHYEATPDQAADFHAMADAGAVVVSGSQAHFPQTFAFASGSLLHYGLGNLFFDQYNLREGTRNAFIDRHVFYNGRYLGAELITIVFIDYARPRFMTPLERSDFLRTVFSADGW